MAATSVDRCEPGDASGERPAEGVVVTLCVSP
jgi:hypothetical protein